MPECLINVKTINGTRRTFNSEDQLHSFDDQPAIIDSFGNKTWCKEGKLHRDNDEPAIVYNSGVKYWFKDGVKYTPDGENVMLASKLIAKLQLLIAEHGDLPVTVDKTKIKDVDVLIEMIDDPDDETAYIDGDVKAFELKEGFDRDRLEGF